MENVKNIENYWKAYLLGTRRKITRTKYSEARSGEGSKFIGERGERFAGLWEICEFLS